MSDDKQPNSDPTAPPPRTANRDFRRTPPVIEGEVTASGSGASGAESPPAPAAESPAPAEAAKQAPAAEPVPPESAPEPAPRGYAFGTVAAASLGGAALAALAVFGLQSAMTPAGPSPAALESRLADVEKRAAAAQAPQVAPAAIASLEKRVASVESVASGAANEARKAAEAAARFAASGPPAASQQALAALDGRIAALEKNATGAVSNLSARILAVEKALTAPKSEERATETRIEPAPPLDLDPLRKQIAALEARLQSLERQTAPIPEAARALEGRLKGLEERIQPLAGRIDESRAQGEAERKRTEAMAARSADAARIALAESISTAIAGGAPFAAQVEALARLGVPADRLAPLRDVAKTGAATNGDLARDLAALEPKIVARAEAPAEASVIDRLASSAIGLVRVRPSGETTGDAPADIFARMSRALRNGDVAAALKDWSRLPEPAKAASAEWAKRAQARLAAEGAARAILADQAQTIGRT
ncbi:MAG: COG4223 family protein [Beijerinckiaceae bacterium]